jgi:hypothetical protein
MYIYIVITRLYIDIVGASEASSFDASGYILVYTVINTMPSIYNLYQVKLHTIKGRATSL